MVALPFALAGLRFEDLLACIPVLVVLIALAVIRFRIRRQAQRDAQPDAEPRATPIDADTYPSAPPALARVEENAAYRRAVRRALHDVKEEALLTRRIVRVSGPIDDVAADVTVAKLLYLQHRSAISPIELQIDSAAGQGGAGFAIADAVAQLRPPVHTVCTGAAGGLAVLILACGRRRSAIAGARIGMHIPHTDEKWVEAAISVLAAKTGRSASQIKRDIGQGFNLGAAEAKEYGLIDEIVAAEGPTVAS